MWVIFALIAAVLTSFNPILYKRMLKDSEPLVVVWSVLLTSLPLLLLFAFLTTDRFPEFDLAFVISIVAAAGLNLVAHLSSAKALQLSDASLVAPLLIFSPAFTVFLSAVFLREIPSARGMLGVALVLIGAYWLNRTSGYGWSAPFLSLRLTRGVWLTLLAGLLWAITPIFEKTAIQHTFPSSPRFTAVVSIALLVLLLTPAVTGRRSAVQLLSRVHRSEIRWAGMIAGLAPVFGYTAFSLGLVGYVSTLFRLSAIMTVLWSYLFLKEVFIRERLLGSLVMVAGAALIAAS